MKELIRFLKEFIQNKGLFVFTSIFVSKFSMLLTNIIAARLISKEEFGLVALVFSVFAIFVPLSGMGSYQGLLRFGVLEKNNENRDAISNYAFRKGMANHLMITVFYFIVCYFYTLKYGNLKLIILLFGVRLVGTYFLNHIQTYLRTNNDNKRFSILNMTVSVVGLAMVVVGTFGFGLTGYLVAMAIMPWVSLIYFKKPMYANFVPTLNFNTKEFWGYSIHSSLNSFFSDILFSIDFMLIGLMMQESDIAFYKTAIILPMNLALLPQIFMQTDYPKLTLNHQDVGYLKYYIKNYYKIFIPLGIAIILVGFLLKDLIVPLFFGNDYCGNDWVFFIILLALVLNMWLRSLYGNLAAAIGKANWNTHATLGAIVIILAVGFWLIPIYGIIGAAVGMALALTFTGIYTMLLFYAYLRNLENGKI